MTNLRTPKPAERARNPRRHDQIYSATEAGLWLIAETQLVLAYPVAMHEHDVVQVLAVMDGLLSFDSPRGRFEMEAGSAVLVPAGVPHRTSAHGRASRCRILDVRIEAPPRSPLACMFEKITAVTRYDPGPAALSLQRDRLREALRKPEPHRLAEVMVVIWSLLATCVGSSTAGERRANAIEMPDPRLAVAESYIREHLHEPVNLASLARAAGVSVSQLTRLYRQHLNTTPARRIESLKVNHGYELLAGGAPSVKEVAAACGYRGVAQFARAFRRVLGRTPSEARKLLATHE